MFKILVILISLCSIQANAYWALSLEGFVSSQIAEPKASYLNTGNRGGKVSAEGAVLELRPGFQWKPVSVFEMVLRSRHFYDYKNIRLESPEENIEISKGYSDLTDAYFVGNFTDNFFTTIGLQNYQWGPAEIASPSNVFFHFNNDQRSFFYKEKGRVLARANWNYSNDLLFVLIAEPVDNNQAYWVANQEFKPQSALKIEKQFSNPANSVSILAGQANQENFYVGEHFNWSPVEGYSLYMDARHQQDEDHFRPVLRNNGFVEITDKENQKNSWSTYGVLGFRYEGDFDFRQEFIFNQSGYDKDDWDLLRKGLTEVSAYVLLNAQNFAKPGLELRSMGYGYSSIRVQDPFDLKDISVAARWLYSLIQNSSVLQLAYEQSLTDALVMSAESSLFLGDTNTEFTLLQKYQVAAGLRYTF